MVKRSGKKIQNGYFHRYNCIHRKYKKESTHKLLGLLVEFNKFPVYTKHAKLNCSFTYK